MAYDAGPKEPEWTPGAPRERPGRSYSTTTKANLYVRSHLHGDATKYRVFTYDAEARPFGEVPQRPHGRIGTLDGTLAPIEGVIDGSTTALTASRAVYANGLESRRSFTPGDALQEVVTEPTVGGPKLQHSSTRSTLRVTKIDDQSSAPASCAPDLRARSQPPTQATGTAAGAII